MNISSQVEIASNAPYLAEARHEASVAAGLIPANNAEVKHSSGTTTTYGEIRAGTVVAKAEDGSLHPCGLCELTAVTTAASVVRVGATNQACYRIGDEVGVYAAASEAKVLAAGAGGATLTVKAKRAGLSIVIAVAGTSTAYSHSFDETTDTITINSATDGGGLATTTLETIQETLLTTYGALIESAVPSNGAAVAAALASTALGYVTAQAIVSGRYITAIDASTGDITLSGGTFTAPIGALLVKAKAYKPYGILDRNISTIETMIGGQTVTVGKTVPVRHEGTVRLRYIVGLSEPVKRALSGAPWTDPVTGAVNIPEVGGFLFRNL